MNKNVKGVVMVDVNAGKQRFSPLSCHEKNEKKIKLSPPEEELKREKNGLALEGLFVLNV